MAYCCTTFTAANPTPIPHSRIAPRKPQARDFFVTLKTATPGVQMHKLGLRFFSPTLHTWISRDPIDEAGFQTIGTPMAARQIYADPVARILTLLTGEDDLLSLEWADPHFYSLVANYPVYDIDPLGSLDKQKCLQKIREALRHIGLIQDHFSWHHCTAIAKIIRLFDELSACKQWAKSFEQELNRIRGDYEKLCSKERRLRFQVPIPCEAPVCEYAWQDATKTAADCAVTVGVTYCVWKIVKICVGGAVAGPVGACVCAVTP